MMRIVLLAALALGSSFAEKTGTTRPKLAQPPAFEGCDAEDVQNLVGRTLTGEAADRAREATGAAIVRVVKPGQAVTMDMRPDRLTIRLDANGQVVSVSCG